MSKGKEYLEEWRRKFDESGMICAVMVDSEYMDNEDSIGRRAWDLCLFDKEELFKAYERGVKQARSAAQNWAKRSFWAEVLRYPEDKDRMGSALRREVEDTLREKYS